MYSRILRYGRLLNSRKLKYNSYQYKSYDNYTINSKPKVGDYFTKLEIATLFLQPLGLILLYFTFSWKLFQYSCGISSLCEFSKSLLWLVNKGIPPDRYITKDKITT